MAHAGGVATRYALHLSATIGQNYKSPHMAFSRLRLRRYMAASIKKPLSQTLPVGEIIKNRELRH